VFIFSQNGEKQEKTVPVRNPLRSILFTCCIQFLLYSSNLSKIGVIFNSFAICAFVL